MREDLENIDTSPIDDLVQIKQEEEVLRGRLAKMEADKGRVSDVVYARVRKDYETKQGALDQRARPLKDKARREYSKLLSLHAAAKKAVENAHVDKEELEYRHELGEFEKKEFEEFHSAAEDLVKERQDDLAAVEELKGRFVGAFHSEDDLTRGLPATPAPPAEPKKPSPSATLNQPLPASSTAAHTAAQPAPSPSATMAGADAAGATTVLPIKELTTEQPAPEGATMVYSMPRIVAMVDGKQGEEFVLKPDTTVGRSPKCQIQLEGDRVSRQHARLVLGSDGYQLIDLGSQNGTKVNGEHVTQHLLADGDQIQIGPYQFVYRS